MTALVDRVQLAGRIAQWLRPPGYDPELVFVLALLQNLGRLVVQYHCAEEAQQIRRLMQPGPPQRPGEPDDPGMSEEGAAFAVLGVDIESVGHALGRQWGLDEPTLLMIRRMPPGQAVLHGERDVEVLRMTASCANEVVDIRLLPEAHRAAAMQRVAQRYSRVLEVTLKEIQQAYTGQMQDAAAASAEDEAAAAATSGAAASGAGE